MGAKADEM